MRRELHVDRAIRGEGESHSWDAAIAVIAARQHGVISRPQLIRLGLSDDAIDRRIRAGRLHPIHRGVYAVGHRSITREGRYLAAVLFAGEGAVLSHCAAADLWELRASKESQIDVIAPTHRRGDATVRIHGDALDVSETTTRQGIRITKPLRTILDLASVIKDETQIERAIRQAVYRKLTTTTLLAEAVHNPPGQRGTKRLRKALINRKHGLPMPELNVKMRIAGKSIEADCVWRERKLIVELDGRDAHHSLPAFESDRARDAALLAARWPVMRVTGRRMRHDGRVLAQELRAILS